MRSFRSKILSINIVSVVLGIFLTSFCLYWIADNALLDSKEKALNIQLHQLGNLVDNTYNDRVDSYKRILNLLSYKTIPYITIENRQVLYNGKPVTDHVLVDDLAQMTGVDVSLFALRDEGFVEVASSVKDKAGARVLNKVFDSKSEVYLSLQKEEPFFKSELNRESWRIVALMPIFGTDKVEGALYVSSLSPGAHKLLTEVVQHERIEETGFYRLMTDAGDTLLTPDDTADIRIELPKEETPAQVVEKDAAVVAAGAAQAEGTPPSEADALMTSHKATVQLNNKEYFLFHRPMQSIGGHIVAAVAKGEIYASSRELLFVSIGVGLALTLICCLVSWMFSTNLSTHFMRISSALEACVNDVTQVSTELLTTGKEIAGVSTAQVDSLEDTTRKMQNISDLTEESRTQVQTSREISNANKEKATGGLKQIQELVKAIGRIGGANQNLTDMLNTSTKELAEFLDALKRIGEKTTVINTVAFQSKLLSFNAAVEAARAGEAGRGFAVVAEEVSELASSSSQVAEEIRKSIDENLQYMTKVNTDMNGKVDGVVRNNQTEIQSGSNFANLVNEFFESIRTQADVLIASIDEINGVCAKQNTGVSSTLEALTGLHTLSQDNHSKAGKVVELSHALKGRSENLNHVLRDIVVAIKGANPKYVTPTPEAIEGEGSAENPTPQRKAA